MYLVDMESIYHISRYSRDVKYEEHFKDALEICKKSNCNQKLFSHEVLH